MKVFFVLLTMFFLSSYLNAYSTKIVLGTFKSDANAKNLVKKLPKIIPQYKELIQLLKSDGSVIHVRKVGDYHLVLAEIFSQKEVAEKSLKILKVFFTNAYINDAPSEKELLEKANAIAQLKEEIEALKKKKIQEKEQKVTKKIKVKQEVKETQQEESTFRSALRYVNIYFLIGFLLLMGLIYYLVGVKEKYDEY